MLNVYLYIENQNEGLIDEISYRKDTAYQYVSNNSYKQIKRHLKDCNINFDFLADNKLKPGDIVLVSNLSPFFRNTILTKMIKWKKFLNNGKGSFKELKKIQKQNPYVKFIPYLWESKEAEPENWNLSKHRQFTKIATWDDGFIKLDPKKYLKLNFQAGPLEKKFNNKIKNKQRKDYLLSFISNAKFKYSSKSGYKIRMDIIEWFRDNAPSKFRLYGGGWESYISKKNLRERNLYKKIYFGTIENKNSIIERSKFYLCIENCFNQHGYITEKIFDALQASVVPVYLGPPNVENIIPKKVFINLRDYSNNYEGLFERLKNMSNSEYEQCIYAGNQFLNENKFLPNEIANQIAKIVDN